jgi:hypothetical protein
MMPSRYVICLLPSFWYSHAPFHSLSQAVTLDMFGCLYHIHPYSGTGCTGRPPTRSPFERSTAAHGTASRLPDCKHVTPRPTSDITVALALYWDGKPTIESIVLGQLDVCHTLDNRFGSITQAVGQGMLGRRIYVSKLSRNQTVAEICDKFHWPTPTPAILRTRRSAGQA